MDFGVQSGGSVGGCPPWFWGGFVKFSGFRAAGQFEIVGFRSPSRENLEQVHKAASLLIFGHPSLRLCHWPKIRIAMTPMSSTPVPICFAIDRIED